MSVIDLSNLFADHPEFQPGNIDTGEFEQLIRDTVAQEHPLDPIFGLEYTEDGLVVLLESGEQIEIQVDWQEFILS